MLFTLSSLPSPPRVPRRDEAPPAPPPDEPLLAPPFPPSPALAADVCTGPLQPKKVSAIRIIANLPWVFITEKPPWPCHIFPGRGTELLLLKTAEPASGDVPDRSEEHTS